MGACRALTPHHLETMVKPVRIYVVGPSSTGKTTLCTAVAKRLGLVRGQFVTEVARKVIRELGLSRDNIGLLEMQEAIMRAHLERERENEDEAIQLCDRSAIDPIVHAIFTAKDPGEAEARKKSLVALPEFQRILPAYRSSVFILLGPVGDWLVDDGFRHMGDQTQVLAVFRSVLEELGIRYREIGPEMRFLEERTEFVRIMASNF
ncbi:AAA domain-containing protein [Roridomyces roridus]|uniref:AAA domain-containing protein n=1 Tax=Roridomyces roridus TaxID=1738132 RepID=A0AAD7C1X7_9AGAR|nr:AAA domain-containing protein [Roridomyces roridus]